MSNSYSIQNLMPKMSNNLGKSVLSGVYAYTLDKYVMGEKSNNRSLMFGGVVAGGMLFEESMGMLLKPVLPMPNFIPKNNVISGKKLVDRIAETLSTTAIVFIVNKYLLRNDIYRDELLKRLAVIAGADMLSVMTLSLMTHSSQFI